MKYRIFYTLIFAFLLPCAAIAAPQQGPKIALEKLVTAINASSETLCTTHLTKASQAYCKRFIGYNLLPCIPTDVTYENSKAQGADMLVRARVTTTNGREQIARLVYSKESGIWKLNVPESLRLGLGPKWEERVNLIEQMFLIVRAQMGNSFSCGTLDTMVDKNL